MVDVDIAIHLAKRKLTRVSRRQMNPVGAVALLPLSILVIAAHLITNHQYQTKNPHLQLPLLLLLLRQIQ